MPKPIQPKGKVKSSIKDPARRLANLRGLLLPAIRAAVNEGILMFGERQGLPAWFFRDAHAGSVRRLDGKPWDSYNKAKAWDVEGSSGEKLTHWPVGILNARDERLIVVCEGAPDAMAAFAVREQMRENFAVVGMLGASLTIDEKALPHFAGKRVRFIAHADSSGREFAERNARRLIGIAEQVSIATLESIRRVDGNEAGDLCEAVERRRSGSIPEEITRLFDFDCLSSGVRVVTGEPGFSAVSTGHPKSVTQDHTRNTQGEHRKTQRTGERSLEGVYDKVLELASTARHQSGRNLFSLAREILAYELSRGGEDPSLRRSMFEVWFSASQPNLDPKKGIAEYRYDFFSVFKKVRTLPGQRNALSEAKERALAAKLPEIPGEPDAPESWRRVCAVCRELQRAAADAPFFLSTRDAAEIATGKNGDGTPGKRILDALEHYCALKCERRGKQGQRGKASEFRYLLPL